MPPVIGGAHPHYPAFTLSYAFFLLCFSRILSCPFVQPDVSITLASVCINEYQLSGRSFPTVVLFKKNQRKPTRTEYTDKSGDPDPETGSEVTEASPGRSPAWLSFLSKRKLVGTLSPVPLLDASSQVQRTQGAPPGSNRQREPPRAPAGRWLQRGRAVGVV